MALQQTCPIRKRTLARKSTGPSARRGAPRGEIAAFEPVTFERASGYIGKRMLTPKSQIEPHTGDECERRQIAAAQRDPARFAALYEENFARVYAFILRRVRSRDDAEDLTAEVFHQALRNLPRYEWRGIPFSAWLMRIAANAVADNARRSARETATADLDPADEARPDASEHSARLFKFVEALPNDQRRVIVMRFAEQKSIAEAARVLGRTEGSIKQLQFRALRNLRQRMEQNDG
jgi:RNA polymerase sigma-70 factor, ECF subfamily